MSMIGGGGGSALIRRFTWVDASNVIRGISEKLELKNSIRADKPTPETIELIRCMVLWSIPQDQLDRYFWVGPCAGGPEAATALGDSLRNAPDELNGLKLPAARVRFEPILKVKAVAEGEKGKGVDSAIVLSMLTNAWNGNYQHGLLLSGDTDFSDLVSELKRHGPIINGAAFRSRAKDLNYKNLFDGWRDLDYFLEKENNAVLKELIRRIRENDKRERA